MINEPQAQIGGVFSFVLRAFSGPLFNKVLIVLAPMGEMIEYTSNGTLEYGYVADPISGEGPALVVIQEWWGLVDHIKDVCDRFAAAGYFAIAPDLYHNKKTDDSNEAAKLAMELRVDQALVQMGGAIDELVRRSGNERVGVVGFCMGGGLALALATARPDRVAAVVPFYGVASRSEAEPDYSTMQAVVQGHFAELDQSVSPELVRALESKLESLGKETEFFVYPGTVHGFFNDTRPGQYDPSAALQAWERTIAFLAEELT